MAGFILPFLALALAYFIVVEYYRRAWMAMPSISPEDDFTPQTPVTILIPARNEAHTIEACLESIARQTYPPALLEVLVIDDASTDETAQRVRNFPLAGLKLLSLADEPGESRVAYKKEALALGVQHARGALIICTDADCILPVSWLRLMVYAHVQNGWQCITGPVLMTGEQTLLERFQGLDIAGMMLLTGAGISTGHTYLANGAAFAFSKKAFHTVGGYTGLTHLASGDDLLLLHKIQQRYPGSVGFLKTPFAVHTHAQPTWGAFFQQRLRWGTKSRGYTNWKITALLALVFFLCWSIIAALAAIPFTPVHATSVFLLILGIKAGTDYLMLKTATQYFGNQSLMRTFFPSQVFHILYISIVGLASNLFRTYTWKGRRVR